MFSNSCTQLWKSGFEIWNGRVCDLRCFDRHGVMGNTLVWAGSIVKGRWRGSVTWKERLWSGPCQERSTVHKSMSRIFGRSQFDIKISQTFTSPSQFHSTVNMRTYFVKNNTGLRSVESRKVWSWLFRYADEICCCCMLMKPVVHALWWSLRKHKVECLSPTRDGEVQRPRLLVHHSVAQGRLCCRISLMLMCHCYGTILKRRLSPRRTISSKYLAG